MGFNHKWVAAVFVLFCVGAGFGKKQSANSGITVMLQNRAGVPQELLRRAEGEASRIFGVAGIGVSWNDCSSTHDCHHAPGPNEFVLSIVADGKGCSDQAYGVAFLDPDGNGKYADVFFKRIEREESLGGANLSRLLGAVAAHELGHLLLGSNAHSYAGIMSPIWGENILHSAEMGSLLFVHVQVALMRAKTRSGSDIRPTTEFTLVRGLGQKP